MTETDPYADLRSVVLARRNAPKPPPTGSIAGLLVERDELLRENELLRQHASDKISHATLMTDLNVNSGGMNMGLQGGAAQLVAESFADQFKNSGAPNYLEITFTSAEKMPGVRFVVTVQRADGETPTEQIKKLKAELAAVPPPAVAPLLTDAEIAAAVRPLYANSTAAAMALSMEIRSARLIEAAVLRRAEHIVSDANPLAYDPQDWTPHVEGGTCSCVKCMPMATTETSAVDHCAEASPGQIGGSLD